MKNQPPELWLAKAKKVQRENTEEHRRYTFARVVDQDEEGKPVYDKASIGDAEKGIPGVYVIFDSGESDGKSEPEVIAKCTISGVSEDGKPKRVGNNDPMVTFGRSLNAIGDTWEGIARFQREDLNHLRTENRELRETVTELKDELRELKIGEVPYEKIMGMIGEYAPVLLGMFTRSQADRNLAEAVSRLAPHMNAKERAALARATNKALTAEAGESGDDSEHGETIETSGQDA